jgi:DNA polymerase-3 subunit beta
LVIKTAESQIGNSISNIDAEIEGEKIEIAFNVRYIIDVLGVLNGTVSLEFNDDASAGIIKQDKDEEFVYIIMPLKLDN